MNHLAQSMEKFVGLVRQFSFYFSHHITTMEGGMIVTNNKKIFQNLKYLDTWMEDINYRRTNQIYKNLSSNWGLKRPTELQAGFKLNKKLEILI